MVKEMKITHDRKKVFDTVKKAQDS